MSAGDSCNIGVAEFGRPTFDENGRTIHYKNESIGGSPANDGDTKIAWEEYRGEKKISTKQSYPSWYTEADKESVSLFGPEEAERIDKVEASYPSLIKKLEAREKKWGY